MAELRAHSSGQSPGGGGFSALAIASVVLGLVGLISCYYVYLAPLAVVAIAAGILAINKIKAQPGLQGRQLAYVGIGLGLLPLLITIAAFTYAIATGGGITHGALR
jgi:hypothetical protein